MSLAVFEDVSLSLGGKRIVDDLRLRIAERDRIGLIGPNGSGKTTLLRMITGQQAPDGGSIRARRGLRVGHLPQDMTVEGGSALEAFVVESVPGRAELERELEQAQAELDASEGDEDRLLELGGHIAELTEKLTHFEREFSAHRAQRILTGLGFQDRDFGRDLGELSGGWRMRAVLAALLFQRPDLLLLDEPTNHLDMPSVAWLSGFLRQHPGAFILISHDREFLNEQIDRVVSFEPEGVRSYSGNYERYRRQREEERAVLEARAKNVEREREQAERFIERFRAKATKAAQVQSRIKKLDKLEDVELQQARGKMRFRFPETERTGRQVLEADGITKRFGEKTVLGGVDVRAERGERIAIIGANGAGKTTLLRILAGELEADAGSIRFGHKVKLGYYAQHHADALPKHQTVYDAVAECAHDGSRSTIRSALGAMCMGDQDVDKPVRVLSGGERARVALARLLVDPGNVLLMDEPTNHLDLESSESLAEALDSFDGTLLFVSHNRHFLRTLATRIWHVEVGRVEVYPGSLDDYMTSTVERLDSLGAPGSERATATAPARKESAKERKRREAAERAERNRRVGPLERSVRALEAEIATLEQGQAERAELLADPALYEDAERRDAVLAAHRDAAQTLEAKTEEWMESQQRLEDELAKLGDVH